MGKEGGVSQGFYMCDEDNRPTELLNLNAFSVAQWAAITDVVALIFILFAQILSPL